MAKISEAQWQEYEANGYLKLGKVMTNDELATLQQRIDDIMLGTADVDYDRMLMQLDSTTGEYKDMGAQTNGHKGATLNYRKIQDLEYDRHFLAYMQNDIMREVCAYIYGDGTDVGSFRAMFMNKPAGYGTLLPWHQDRWTTLDRDPQITVWTALDPATVQNGCVQVLSGTHKLGLVNPEHPSGFVSEEQADEILQDHQPIHLELEAGEAVLLHNWLLHSSDTNRSDIARRAFSVCYMEAATVDKSGKEYPMIFGEEALAVPVVN